MTRKLNRPTDRDGGPVALLIAILTDRPNLPAAACRDRWRLFDAARDGDAVACVDADRVCTHCSHTTRCPDSRAARPHQRTA